MIRINDQQFWQYTAGDPQSTELLHARLFAMTTTALTEIFLRELRQKHDAESAVFVVDGAKNVRTALSRAELRFRDVATEIRGPSNGFLRTDASKLIVFELLQSPRARNRRKLVAELPPMAQYH